MSVAEIRMLRWISGNTRKDKIQTKENCLKIRVTPIDEKMRESCLSWFGHVHRITKNERVKKSELIQVERTKKHREIPKITLIEAVKRNCQLWK